MRISRSKRVERLRRKSVEKGVDAICIGGLHSGIRLKPKPGGIFLTDVLVDSNCLYLFVISAGMRNTLAIRAAVAIIRNCRRNSTHIERTAKHGEWCTLGISVE